MLIIKGGYSFVEFDTVSAFTNPIRIDKLLKASTGFVPKTLTEDFADGKPGSAGKSLEMTIRSANIDASAGSAYDLLKTAENARTPYFFRFVKLLGESLLIEDCENAWNESVNANCISSADSVLFQAGTKSEKLLVNNVAGVGAAGLVTQIIAKNLTGMKAIALWIQATSNKNRGDLEIDLDNTAACASPLERLPVPALTGGVWSRVNLVLSNPAALGTLISIGLKTTVALAQNEIIHLDDIQGVTGYVTVLTNVIPKVVFELNEAGKHNAIKITGEGFSDTEANLLTTNF
jgi:hypothetical protein